MNTDEIALHLRSTFERHSVIRAALFGSYARREEKEDSDIDIVVELPSDKSLLDLISLKLDLEEALGREVDVLTYRSLHRGIREKILQEQVVIHG